MSNDRVSDGDKRRARQIVDQGLAAGKIIQADRDKRIEQIGNAQSVDELRMLTHDLDRSPMFGGTIESPSPVAPPPPPPAATPPAASPPPPPVSAPAPPVSGTTPMFGASSVGGAPPASPPGMTVPYGPPGGINPATLSQIEAQMGNAAKQSGRSCLGCLIPLIVVLAVFGGTALVAYNDIRNAIEDAFDGSSNNGGAGRGSVSQKEDPDVLSVDGWNDLEAAIEAETGRTEVFLLVLYPTYAVATVPVDATSARSEMFRWDGALSSMTTNRETSERIDLADVNAAAIPKLVAKARKLVDDPSTWYAIVEAPVFNNASILAFATNDFGETATIFATADGKIVSKTLPSG